MMTDYSQHLIVPSYINLLEPNGKVAAATGRSDSGQVLQCMSASLTTSKQSRWTEIDHHTTRWTEVWSGTWQAE